MNARTIRRDIERGLSRSWRTLGLPTAEAPVDEGREGVVDVEALLLATLLHVSNPRLLGDVATWVVVYADLLLHQKLSSLVRRLDLEGALAGAMRTADLAALPNKTRAALGALPRSGRSKPATDRTGKLAPRPVVARNSHMIFNRLLFGASARADIITTLQLRDPPRSGAALAKLLAVDGSTVSRVLGDLRACDKIGKDFRFADAEPIGAGFFVSVATLNNLSAIVDAVGVESAELRAAMLPDIDERTDGLGHALLLNGRRRRPAGRR